MPDTVYTPLETAEEGQSDLEEEEHVYEPEKRESCLPGFPLLIILLVVFWGVLCVLYATHDSDGAPEPPQSDSLSQPRTITEQDVLDVISSPGFTENVRVGTKESDDVSSSGYSYTQAIPTKRPTRGEDSDPPTPTFAPTPKPVVSEKAEAPTPTFAPTPKPVRAQESEPPTPTYAPTPKPVHTPETEPPTPTFAPTPKPTTPEPTEGAPVVETATTKWPNQAQSYGKYFFSKYEHCGPELANLKDHIGATMEEMAIRCDNMPDCVGIAQNNGFDGKWMQLIGPKESLRCKDDENWATFKYDADREALPTKAPKKIEIVDVPVRDAVHIDHSKPPMTAEQIEEYGPRFNGNPDQTTQQFPNPSSDPERIDDLGSPRKSIDFDIDEAIKTFQARMDYMCGIWPGNDENCKLLAVPFQPEIETPAGEMTPLQRKLMRVILEEKPEDRHFVASFTGSSNSAGHGAYGKHAYPLLVNFACRETFKKIGVDFVSRNQALGSMSAYPHSTMCHSSVFGFDADFITYEFGMFREGDCPKEMWARLGYQMPRQPVVAGMNPGGGAHCATHYGHYWGKMKDAGRMDEFMGHMGLNGGKFPWPESPEWYLSDDYMTKSGRNQDDLKWLEENLPVTEDSKWGLNKQLEGNTCTRGNMKCNQLVHELYNDNDLGFYDYRFILGSYIDYMPFYLMRSQLCRMAHHPSDLGHFLAAEQIGYIFLREMVEALKFIKESNSEQGLEQLYVKATKKYSLPQETKIPGCRIGGEERLPICWTGFRPQSGPSLYDIVEDYQGWKIEERFSPYEAERNEYKFRDEHTVIEGHHESGWLTLKPVTVTPEIVKNHDDGTAWLSVCNGMLRYCDKKKGKPCTDWNVKKDVQFKIDDEIVVWENDWQRFEAGAKKDTVKYLGRWLPFHTSTTESYPGITDHVNMRSGYCLALKNVPPGDYQIAMRVVNPQVRTWLTHVMIL